jgi:hypothetical protein
MQGGGRPAPGEAESASAVARYIAEMTGDLAQLARRYRLDALAFILEMARLEADQIAKASANPGAGLPG